MNNIRKSLIFPLLLLLVSCSTNAVNRAPLPSDELLIIAHRGASAYLPEHTIPAYELAVEMGADYIELDLHMTKDKKLVALHDSELSVSEKEQRVSQITKEELKDFSPGTIFNEQHPNLASSSYEALFILELDEILTHFKDEVNYYIETKSPHATPGMEEELLRQLQAHGLLNRTDNLPKVIIQSYSAESLKEIFDLDPSIPLIKLYGQKTKRISDKEIEHLLTYASGIGVNDQLLTQDLINRLHENELHVHPFVLNDNAQIENAINLGVDGLFTDKPDQAVQLKNSMIRN